MANIATLLARILTTRYGRDMRQDLHDAIEAVNNDTENALGKKLTFTNNTRKLKLLANDDTVLSEVVIPGGGSGSGSVDSVNGLFPDEEGNVEVNLNDINDVDITSAEDGQTLVYDATSGKWVNGSGGGGTTDYTDLSNKPSINGVTLSGNKTSADLGISGGGSNENLIPNGWFNINTKNTGTFNAFFDGTSKIDGWVTNVNSNGQAWTWASDTNTIFLNCTLGTGFGQIVHEYNKNPLINGKEFTLSVLYADGTIKTKTATYQNSSSAEWTTDTYSGSFAGVYSVPSSNNYLSVYFRCNEGYSALIKAIKLEIGGSSTLIVDTFPNPNLEKVRCNGVMRSNRNLLDNPWFTVNQKGFTSGSDNGTIIDRWKNISGYSGYSFTLNSSGLTINKSSSAGYLMQYWESALDDGVYTLSIMDGAGNIISNQRTIVNGQANTWYATVGSITFSVVLYNNRLGFYCGENSSGSCTIRAMKLEKGTESTLALDVAPSYTEELLKCQRYYVPLKSYFSYVYGHSATTQIIRYPLATPMRTTPTLYGSATIEGGYNGSYQTETVATSDITIYNLDNIISMNISTTKSYDLGSCCTIGWSNAYLSAEL